MKNRISYTNEPMELEVIEDFLPPPKDLVRREDTLKVTIGLSKPTVDFFKREARRNGTRYQRMIRRVLDLYAARYQRDSAVHRRVVGFTGKSRPGKEPPVEEVEGAIRGR